MPFDVLIHDEADIEVRKAAYWYKQQRPGLEHEFLDEVDAALDRLSRTGDVMPVVYRELRCMYVQRFPYGIYYRIREARVTVVAVLHNRQDLSRLDERSGE